MDATVKHFYGKKRVLWPNGPDFSPIYSRRTGVRRLEPGWKRPGNRGRNCRIPVFGTHGKASRHPEERHRLFMETAAILHGKASPHPEERHRFFMRTAAILHGKSSNSPQKLHCIFRNTTLFYQEHKPVSSRRTATFHHGYYNFPPRKQQYFTTEHQYFIISRRQSPAMRHLHRQKNNKRTPT